MSIALSPILALGERITCLPVIHGSGEFALAVRRLMLERTFDCVAVPLPPSFQAEVERGIEMLPGPTLVTHNVSEFSRVPGLSIEDWQV